MSAAAIKEWLNFKCTDRNVFFGSNEALLVYDYNNIKVINAPADSGFHNFFKVDDKIFVQVGEAAFKFVVRKTLFVESKVMFC